jgi:hypothetical protein
LEPDFAAVLPRFLIILQYPASCKLENIKNLKISDKNADVWHKFSATGQTEKNLVKEVCQ